MTSKEFVLDTMRKQGYDAAMALQEKAGGMTGTELNSEAGYIPSFQAAKQKMNMLERPIGFVCRSTAGRVVALIQQYNSDTFPQEPEELAAQWRFKWSKDPAHALPFVALSTSPYDTGECCTEDGVVYRSAMDGNTHAPSAYPRGWEAVEA